VLQNENSNVKYQPVSFVIIVLYISRTTLSEQNTYRCFGICFLYINIGSKMHINQVHLFVVDYHMYFNVTSAG